jgi:branched-chain amino acid transport system permease protein
MANETAIMSETAPRPLPVARIAGWLLLAAVLVAFPAFANGYLVFMATLVAINAIATVGLNITVGYAGLLSIGHSAFVGVGA